MRSTDEQLREIITRANDLQKKQNIKKAILADSVAACIAAVLMIAVTLYLPHFDPEQPVQQGSRFGSLLLAAPYIGYVIIVLLAFALGVCLTLLLLNVKKIKERDKKWGQK